MENLRKKTKNSSITNFYTKNEKKNCNIITVHLYSYNDMVAYCFLHCFLRKVSGPLHVYFRIIRTDSFIFKLKQSKWFKLIYQIFYNYYQSVTPDVYEKISYQVMNHDPKTFPPTQTVKTCLYYHNPARFFSLFSVGFKPLH